MAYDREKIFEQAKEVIVKNNLIFIEEIVAFLPITKPTFYEFFKTESNEFNTLKDLLDQNKVKTKTKLRKNWAESENATLNVSLYKLLATDEEIKKLSMNYNENKNENTNIDKTPFFGNNPLDAE